MSKTPTLNEMLKLCTKKDLWERIQHHIATIDQLKQQLVEKQNEIEEINKEFVQAVHDWKALCVDKDKEIERLKVFEKAYYFNQLQASQEDIQQFQQLANQSAVNINHIAITELEKVKMLIEWKFNSIVEVREYLQQQIKELKGEKDVKD